MRTWTKIAMTVLAAAVAISIIGDARAQTVQPGHNYFIRGTKFTETDSVVQADGTVVHYFFWGSDSIPLADTLAGASTLKDTVKLRAVNVPVFSIYLQYKTRGQLTGSDSAVTVKIRPILATLPTSFRNQILDTEWVLKADSSQLGWWSGTLPYSRPVGYMDFEIRTNNPDFTPIDSLRIGFFTLTSYGRVW